MGLRETINENSVTGIVIAVILFLVAGGLSYWTFVGFRPSVEVAEGKWFFDANTGKLFAADTGDIPPIEAPSGGEGLQAHVYTCADDCGGHDLEGLTPDEVEGLGLFVGYLERLEPEGQEIIEQIRNSDLSAENRAMQTDTAIMRFSSIRMPKQKKWYPRGQALTSVYNQVAAKCGGQRPKNCFPGD